MEQPNGSEDASIPGDEAKLHPALIGAARRGGKVGAREAAATLVRLIGAGVISARPVSVKARVWGREVSRTTTELCLVSNEVAGRHKRGGGPVIKQGHIGGLSKIDRALLALVFDRIAHGKCVTLLEINEFASRNAWSYWSALKEWRELVRDVAREKGLLPDSDFDNRELNVWRLKTAVRRRIAEVSEDPGNHASARLAQLAVVFGYERRLARELKLPRGVARDVSPSAGSDSMRWVLLGSSHANAPILAMTSSFAPLYSSGIAPAQYVGVSLPRYGAGGAYGGGGGFSGGGGDGGGGGGGGAD